MAGTYRYHTQCMQLPQLMRQLLRYETCQLYTEHTMSCLPLAGTDCVHMSYMQRSRMMTRERSCEISRLCTHGMLFGRQRLGTPQCRTPCTHRLPPMRAQHRCGTYPQRTPRTPSALLSSGTCQKHTQCMPRRGCPRREKRCGMCQRSTCDKPAALLWAESAPSHTRCTQQTRPPSLPRRCGTCLPRKQCSSQHSLAAGNDPHRSRHTRGLS